MDRNSDEYKRLCGEFFAMLIKTCKDLNYDLSLPEGTSDMGMLYMLLAEGFIADADGVPFPADASLEDVFDDVLSRGLIHPSEYGPSHFKSDAAISIFTKSGYRQFDYDGSEEYDVMTGTDLLCRDPNHSQYCVQQFGRIKALYDDILIQFKNTDSIFSSDSPAYKELCESMSTVSETLSNCDPLGQDEDMQPVDYRKLSQIFNTLKGSMDYYTNTHKGPGLSDRQQARSNALARLSFLTKVVNNAADNDEALADEFSYGSENLMNRSPLSTEELFADDLCCRLALGLAEAKGGQEYTALLTDKELLVKKVNDLGRYLDVRQFIDDKFHDDMGKVSSMSSLKLAKTFIKEYPDTAKTFAESLSAASAGINEPVEIALDEEPQEPDVFAAPEDDVPKQEDYLDRYPYQMAAELIQKASVDMLKDLKDNESFFHSKEYGKFKAALTRISGKIGALDLMNGDMSQLGEALQNLSDAADKYIRYHKDPDHTMNYDVRNRLMTANNVLLLTQGIARLSEKGFSAVNVRTLMEDYVAARIMNEQIKSVYAEQKEENIGRYLNDKKPRSFGTAIACDNLLIGLNPSDDYPMRVNGVKKDPAFVKMMRNCSTGDPRLEALFSGGPQRLRSAYNEAREQIKDIEPVAIEKDGVKLVNK